MMPKIINALLVLFAVYMGLKQGYAMLSGKPEMTAMFSKWQFSRNHLMILGTVTILSAIMILFPKTFVGGNFLMAATILLITCFHLRDHNLKGAITELPFLLLNLIIIFLQYPFSKNAA